MTVFGKILDWFKRWFQRWFQREAAHLPPGSRPENNRKEELMTAFDKVLDWFKDSFQRDAAHRLAPLLPDGIGTIKATEHYFRLWLDQMFLTDEKRWFTDWHPAVHSAVTLDFGNQTQVITRIAGASALKDVDSGHLNRVIQQTTKLTDLMPFRGGTIRINAALLAMKGTDSVKQLIDVLGEISTKLAVPQLSMALDVAKPLAQGVSALVGVTDGEMMVGLDTTLAGESLVSGSFAIVFATESEIPPKDLSVTDRQLRFRGQELTGRNYMVIRIERLDERDDFDSLSAIHDPYQQAIDLLTDGDLPPAQKALKKAIGAALKSDDLTESDRRRVIDVLKKRYANAQDLIGSNAVKDDLNPSLSHLMRSTIVIKPTEAAALGKISELEAYENLN